MDEINLSFSQDSLLPFSQETYNFLLNIICQNGSGQLMSDLNDLSEIVPDPLPQVPPARSSLPATDDWPGDVGFKVTFGLHDENLAKNANWVYSEKEKKLYVKKDAPCPISFSTSYLMPPGRIVRAMVLYKSPEHASEAVTRCLNHSIPEIEQKIVEAEHLIRNESSSAIYHEDNKRHSVAIPFVNPPSGHSLSTYIYKFVCFSSCSGGPNRRALTLLFTLEENNRVIGRHSFDLKICACPGRDSVVVEKAAPSCSKKQKIYACPGRDSGVVEKAAPSCSKKQKEPSPQAMLPKQPASNFKPKKKSEGKRKEFTIETNDVECYYFLRQMRRLHHFNERMIGLPEELSVFFNLLRSSSSEDERSHDEENKEGSMDFHQ